MRSSRASPLFTMMYRLLTRMGWVLTGALLGALLGLLFSPSAGQDVRRKLSYCLSRSAMKLYEAVRLVYHAKHRSPSLAQTQGKQLISHTVAEAKRLLKDVDSLVARLKS